MKFEYLCERCSRRQLWFVQPPSRPTCRHGRRWSLRLLPMTRIS